MENGRTVNEDEFKLDVVSIRLVDDPPMYSDTPINSPEAAISLLGEEMQTYDREMVYVMNLNTKGAVVNANLVSMGSLSNAIVAPREIFKSAILSNASDIILLHNHPSGDPRPSGEDYAVTERLGQCGELLGIRLMDHIIIGGRYRYYSFNEHRELVWQKEEGQEKEKEEAAECGEKIEPYVDDYSPHIR